MRPVDRIRKLHEILQPTELTTVVDIGANPFTGNPPYGALRRSDRCHVIGFEPQEEALQALLQAARSNDLFLPYAISDGKLRDLYLTKNSGLVSTLRPQERIGRLLGPWWQRAVQINSVVSVETKTLDDVAEVDRVDFLKIDIQGGELEVFRNAREKLGNCAAIQTEICLHPYYDEQPTFGEIQAELAGQGFIAHKFVEMSAHPISHDIQLPKELKIRSSQATVADMIFVKDPTDMSRLDGELVKHLTLVSFSVFRSFDLTLRCAAELRSRSQLTALDCDHIVDLVADAT